MRIGAEWLFEYFSNIQYAPPFWQKLSTGVKVTDTLGLVIIVIGAGMPVVVVVGGVGVTVVPFIPVIVVVVGGSIPFPASASHSLILLSTAHFTLSVLCSYEPYARGRGISRGRWWSRQPCAP